MLVVDVCIKLYLVLLRVEVLLGLLVSWREDIMMISRVVEQLIDDVVHDWPQPS